MTMPTAAQVQAAAEVITIYRAIRAEQPGPLGSVSAAGEVRDRLSGLLFTLHQIGVMLTLAGGMPLRTTIIDMIEEDLDDVRAAAFLHHRWDHLS